MTEGRAGDERRLWLGVDVGGTFTDLVLYDEAEGSLIVEKVPSSPPDPTKGISAGLARLGTDLAALAKFTHGTTVATNTLLERKGARTAVVTTRGFRDALEVGRGNRTKLYDVTATRPASLVPRSRILEIDERTLFDGTVLRPVGAGQLEAIAAHLKDAGIEAVAVCYLHSYVNDQNEQMTKRLLAERLPGVLVATSADILPEFREYERFATTAANVYVGPALRNYLETLKDRLAKDGYRKGVSVMVSNGGAWPLERLAELPINSVLSGPAAGVIGAAQLTAATGTENLITCDMGGTSTDTCLIADGAFTMTTEGRLGDLAIKSMQIEINSIGAGAGSVAWLEAKRFLNVGPRSAGAVPGPACYGRGGNEPTVTDANVVLGRLGTEQLLGGEIRIDREAAEKALAGLARQLGLATDELAEGIIDLAVAKMTASVKEISVMRGFDPRDFALFAYGGAGPLHAALVADQLGCAKVLVPPLPGTFSAFGLLMADTRHDFVRTHLLNLDEIIFDDLSAEIEALREQGRESLAADGFSEERMRFEATLDMRYQGQAFELAIPVPSLLDSIEKIREAFKRTYEQRYAYRADDPAEIVNIRLAAYGVTSKPPVSAFRPPAQSRQDHTTRRAVFGGKEMEMAVVARSDLATGAVISGPAVIEEAGATTLVPPAFGARVHETGLLIMERR